MRSLFSRTRLYLAAQRAPEGVITRLAPSLLIDGCRGVFLTAGVKKFTPIEVRPAAAGPLHSSSSPSSFSPLSSSPSTTTATKQMDRAADEETVKAPPYVCNLALAPRRTISLRRFLALRHAFSQGSFLNVATEGGWYLLTPSHSVPLPDSEGLARWLSLHHPRYQSSTPAAHEDHQAPTKAERRTAFRRRAYEQIGKSESEELSEEELLAVAKSITEEEAAVKAKDEAEGLASSESADNEAPNDENDDDEDADTDESEDGKVADAHTAAPELPSQEQQQQPPHHHRRSPRAPPLIPETHLFELNDAIYWPLPPSDNVAEPSYWAHHRLRMRLYQDTNTIRPEDHEQFLADALEGRLRTPPAEASDEDKAAFEGAHAAPAGVAAQGVSDAALGLTQQQLYDLSEELYRRATRKANAEIHVDDATGLVTLVPLMDLEEGTELLLHYGREWWLQRLLSMVLLAVPDAQMPQIRWIEGVCAGRGGGADDGDEQGTHLDTDADLDVTEPFPQLVLARRQARRPRRSHRRHTASEESATADSAAHESPSDAEDDARAGSDDKGKGKRVLFNVATRDRASDAQALAFAVRRSCLDRDFYAALLFWRGAQRRRTTGEIVVPAQHAVFSLDRPDEEVPLSALRQALVHSLDSERYAADTDVEDVLHDVAASPEDTKAEESTEETFSV